MTNPSAVGQAGVRPSPTGASGQPVSAAEARTRWRESGAAAYRAALPAMSPTAAGASRRQHAMGDLASLGRAAGMKDAALLDYFQQRYVETFAGRGGITREAAKELAEQDYARVRTTHPNFRQGY